MTDQLQRWSYSSIRCDVRGNNNVRAISDHNLTHSEEALQPTSRSHSCRNEDTNLEKARHNTSAQNPGGIHACETVSFDIKVCADRYF